MKDETKTKGRPVEGISTPRRKRAALERPPGRKPSVEADQQARSLLTSILESTADGILVIDNNGKVTIFNNKFLSMWHIPESLAAKRDDKILLENVLSQLKDPDGFIEKVKQLYSQPEANSFDILEFKDGRVFERFSQPQRLGNETLPAECGVFVMSRIADGRRRSSAGTGRPPSGWPGRWPSSPRSGG